MYKAVVVIRSKDIKRLD